ncbi:PREDICTED: alpha-2-macroglobulin receptor-associated protein [Myotis brandtii]|uniref:alpha-2-macroglobulin receptor-associated protein n=1 Tax=Myotis brandtii TaxID=109478 RepID=UPI0007041817|nr:PREDICTED: alpha-2-macroglobulin receptor-associated protein [Myotis brandtii]
MAFRITAISSDKMFCPLGAAPISLCGLCLAESRPAEWLLTSQSERLCEDLHPSQLVTSEPVSKQLGSERDSPDSPFSGEVPGTALILIRLTELAGTGLCLLLASRASLGHPSSGAVSSGAVQRCQASPVPPQLQLSPVDLSELHADLKIQERDEFAWKKLKAEGLDEDGEKEAKLIRNLNGTFPPPHPGLRSHSACGRDAGPFPVPRYYRLPQAKTSGKFSRDELDKLWREFQHHREKVQEYNVLLETLSRTEEIQENAINPSDMRRAQEEVLHSRHAELKDRLRKPASPSGACAPLSTEFEEPRVIDLWDLAQSANFSEKELEAFREELKHFEVKIEKHNHYQKQLEISHQKLRHVERFGDHEHLSRNKERYALLEEKTKELGYKAKKLTH